MVHNDDCPMNEDDGCVCLMNSYFYMLNEFYDGVDFKHYGLDRTYHVPLRSDQVNKARADEAGITDSLYPWDGEHFSV